MSAEYLRIYRRASEDPGTAGDEGEENWAAFLREWLPPNYQVFTKGRLISAKGELSPQVDVLVLKPFYPKKLTEKRVWLADGVAAAFECKTTLNAKHVASAYTRSQEFKRLSTKRKGSPREELTSPLIYGVLAHSHSWKRDKSRPIENVSNALYEAATNGDHPTWEPDLICVSDLAFWARHYTSCYDSNWQPESNRDIFKRIFGADVGPLTGYICSSSDTDGQKAEYRPIGSLIATLTRLLAWDDPSLRTIADYYRFAGLWGNGAGNTRPWPISSYSDEVKSQILRRRFSNGILWDDWSIGPN